jgi:DNA-binding NarL/FixJ family response regulator
MNIVIADDHTIVRRGLRQIIETESAWTVTAEVASADEVLPVLRSTRADLLVLDVSFGGRSGIDLLSSIRAEFPSLPVLILSMHHEEQFAMRALRAGASGYIQKDRTADELIEAMRRVGTGHKYLSDSFAEQLALEVVGARTAVLHERLAPREFEVFLLLAGGKTVGEIAALLNLSAKTVSTHRTRILEKTGLHSNADIVAYAIRTGLI